MDRDVALKINELIDIVHYQQTMILGLQAKAKALTLCMYDLAGKTNNSEISISLDDRFWHEFQELYNSIEKPWEHLQTVHASLSQISKDK